MKIGYFTSKYPYPPEYQVQNYSYGGSVLATYYLSQELAKERNNIYIFTSSADKFDHTEYKQNMEIHRYAANSRILSSNISLNLFIKPKIGLCDLIHTSFDIPPAPLAGVLALRKKKIPSVITYHGDWDSSYGNFFRRFFVSVSNRIITKTIMEQTDIIICPSKIYAMKSEFLKKYQEKIEIIPNGVNLEQFVIPLSKEDCRKKLGFPVEGKIILFFGFLSPYKGPDLLLKAFSKIYKNNPTTILVFVGKGVMLDELKKYVRKEHLNNQVIFLGYIDEKLKPICYKASDIFCLPSTLITECYPLSVLEAMASGVLVVASDIGGIPDIIRDGNNGFLVKPNDIENLQELLSFLLINDSYREKIAQNSMKFIQDYSWGKIAQLTKKVYGELI